ncbi:unnamed protein product, partial [Ixodes hexagonus]
GSHHARSSRANDSHRAQEEIHFPRTNQGVAKAVHRSRRCSGAPKGRQARRGSLPGHHGWLHGGPRLGVLLHLHDDLPPQGDCSQ